MPQFQSLLGVRECDLSNVSYRVQKGNILRCRQTGERIKPNQTKGHRFALDKQGKAKRSDDVLKTKKIKLKKKTSKYRPISFEVIVFSNYSYFHCPNCGATNYQIDFKGICYQCKRPIKLVFYKYK